MATITGKPGVEEEKHLIQLTLKDYLQKKLGGNVPLYIYFFDTV